MPLTGVRDITSLATAAAVMPSLDTGTCALPGATILQVLYEIEEAGMVALLPQALHPTIPPTVVFNVTRAPESPAGPFTLAEVRIGCRSAMRPRAFLARAYCDNAAAADMLRNRWGYPVVEAAVELHRYYERVNGRVGAGGECILDVSLMNPEPISGADIQYLPNVNLARVARDGGAVTRLIQVDPDYTFAKADRGKPRLDAFLAEAWAVEGCAPYWPVSASVAVADITLPRLRYIIDPEKPPMQSVEKV